MAHNEVHITPWEAEAFVDYNKLIKIFGTKPITDELIKLTTETLGDAHFMLRRKVFYSHRDYDVPCRLKNFPSSKIITPINHKTFNIHETCSVSKRSMMYFKILRSKVFLKTGFCQAVLIQA